MPYIYRGGGEAKVGAADFGQRPLSSTRDAQPMNSQPGKLSVLPGRVKTGGVTPIVYAGFLWLHSPLNPSFPWLVPEASVIFRIEGCPDAVAPLSAAMQRPGSDPKE